MLARGLQPRLALALAALCALALLASRIRPAAEAAAEGPVDLSSHSCAALAADVLDIGIPEMSKMEHNLLPSQLHQLGQIAGRQVVEAAQAAIEAGAPVSTAESTVRSNFLDFQLAGMSTTGHMWWGGEAYGFYHGSVWYTAGVTMLQGPERAIDWDYVQRVLCSDPSYEPMTMCVHAIGHAGFMQVAKNQDECTVIADFEFLSDIPEPMPLLEAAYAPCAAAPSSHLEWLCSNGFYHSVADGFQERWVTQGRPWHFPCAEASMRMRAMFFTLLFQGASTGSLAEYLTVLSDDSKSSSSRSAEDDAAVSKGIFYLHPTTYAPMQLQADLDICLSLPSEADVLHCTFGLSSLMPMGMLASMVQVPGAEPMAWSFKEWCSFFPPSEEKRWSMCVAGFAYFQLNNFFWMLQMPAPQRRAFCDGLTEVDFPRPEFGNELYALCVKLTNGGHFSKVEGDWHEFDEQGIPLSRPPGTHTWALWNASTLEQYLGYVSPLLI
jgi:hypothetical protein